MNKELSKLQRQLNFDGGWSMGEASLQIGKKVKQAC